MTTLFGYLHILRFRRQDRCGFRVNCGRKRAYGATNASARRNICTALHSIAEKTKGNRDGGNEKGVLPSSWEANTKVAMFIVLHTANLVILVLFLVVVM